MSDVELGPEDAYVVQPVPGMGPLAQAWLTEPDWRDPLVRRRVLPPGGVSAYVPMRDAWPVRSLRWMPRNDGRDPDRPTILILTGRADFAEKYCETLHDLTEAGWGVAIFDWRGQGLSRRLGKTPQHGASPGFGVWLDDLKQMLEWAAVDGPVHVLGVDVPFTQRYDLYAWVQRPADDWQRASNAVLVKAAGLSPAP
jgi:predicted alpha/beta-fold hydrolase